ncbi:MAG: hydroxyacid dehydrogenase [Promethearchaeota archaeon]
MKILIADSIAAPAVEVLKKNYEVIEQHFSQSELLNEISKYHAIIVRSATKIPREVIEKGTKLKVIGRAGVGVDNIDVEAATENEIFVVNSPQASTISVAEITIGYILALSRNLVQATNETKKGKWPKKRLMGTELYKKKLGFIGCGRIGAEVAKRAQVFGMHCLVYDPYLPPEVPAKIGVEMTDDLDKLFRISDFITIHAWLTEETRGMVSKNELKKMKSTSFLVNCARGGIVDEDALYDALKEKKIAGAALDVFSVEPAIENRLFELENLYVSPHIAASTKEAQIRAGLVTAEQVQLVLSGKEPKFCVNANKFK